MSREIRFRAWISKLSVIIQPEEICYIAFTESNGAIVHEFGEPINAVYEDVILMQYTGLKDKNGVEIYEGDLVIGTGKVNPYPIIFDDGCFGYDSGEGLLELDFERHMEVIGNIHQHPDLLNKS
jgi:uncharacterized phage protein (TIGR01671 family)